MHALFIYKHKILLLFIVRLIGVSSTQLLKRVMLHRNKERIPFLWASHHPVLNQRVKTFKETTMLIIIT